MNTQWIKNIGIKPNCKLVHLKLNCDEPDMPGIQAIHYNQYPNKWEWTLLKHSIAIEEYMIVE